MAASAAALALLAVLAGLAVFWEARRRSRFTVARAVPRLSAVDGRAYRVQPGHGDAQAAADAVAAINGRLTAVLRALRAKYRGAGGARGAATARLLARYDPDALAENSPRDPTGDTSYTLDKGALIALCLRQRGAGGGALHDLDTLTFVAVHEMAHVATVTPPGVDSHAPVFWSTFRFLLEEAAAAKVFAPPDFALRPVAYCGLRVDYNPAFDPGVPSL